MSLSVDNVDGETSVSFSAVKKYNPKYQQQKMLVNQDSNLEIKINKLIYDRENMILKIVKIDEEIFNTEVSLLQSKNETLKSTVDQIYCHECNQIEDPRLRKKFLLHQIHGEILYDKPKHLLCVYGLFKQFERVALEGLLEATFNNDSVALRCGKCKQIIETEIYKKILMLNLLNYIQKNKNDALECSVENCCQKCTAYSESFLKLEASKPDNAEPNPTILDRKVNAAAFSRNSSYNPFEEDIIDEDKTDSAAAVIRNEIITLTKSDDESEVKIQNNSIELEEQIKNLKLQLVNLNVKVNEQALELKQEKIKTRTAETGEVKLSSVTLCTPYTLGKDIMLSSFSAKPEEDPHLLLQRWEVELTKCGIPQEDWTFFISRALEGTAKGWWESQSCSYVVPFEDFCTLFLKSFGRSELRRWLTYAGNLCLAAQNEPIGTYITTRFQIVLRALGQNRKAAIALIEKHLNSRLGKYYILNSFEDFYFVLVAEQALDFNGTKLLFHHVLAEIRDDERYWK